VVGRHLEPFGLHRAARRVGSSSGSGGGQTSPSPPPCLSPGAVSRDVTLLIHVSDRTRVWGKVLRVVRIRFRHFVSDPLIRSGIRPAESGPCNSPTHHHATTCIRHAMEDRCVISVSIRPTLLPAAAFSAVWPPCRRSACSALRRPRRAPNRHNRTARIGRERSKAAIGKFSTS